MSEVLVTNDRAMPVPVAMTGLARWEVSGFIQIDAGEAGGQAEFTVPVNRLFVVTFVSADGRYHHVSPDPAAMKTFSIHSAVGTTFRGASV